MASKTISIQMIVKIHFLKMSIALESKNHLK